MLILNPDIATLQLKTNQLLSSLFSSARFRPVSDFWPKSLYEISSLMPECADPAGRVFTWRAVAAKIAEAYRTLESHLGNIPKGHDDLEVIDLKEMQWDQSSRHRRLRDDLNRLWEMKLCRYASGLYLHGSLATGDFNSYSDCDTLIVLKNNSVTEVHNLLILRKLLLTSISSLKAFDPYQHHSHFIATEMDLSAYPDTLLPVSCLRYAAVLQGDFKLTIRRRSAKEEAVNSCRSLASSIVAQEGQNPINWSGYQLKSFLSRVMLLPALLLGMRGEFVYKRDSFALVHKLFSEEELAGVQWASSLRENWPLTSPYLSICRKLAGLGVIYLYIEILLRNLKLDHSNALGLPDLDTEHVNLACRFAHRCLDLADEIEKGGYSDVQF